MITLYQGARNPVPLRADDWPSWAELCADLELLLGTEAAEKTDLFAIGPHRLAKPYRTDANVAALDLLALDVDRCNAEQLLERIERIGLAAAVYGSPSDDPAQPDARRVRVLAPASRPILPAECAATRCAFAELLKLEPGQGVEACLNPGGLFFIGRIEGTAPRAWAWRDGAAVDIDGLLSVPLEREWRPGKASTGASPAAASRGLPEAEESPRAAELGALLAPRWLAGGRIESHAWLNLAGWLLGRGWRRAELAGLLDCLDENEPSAAKRAEHRRILSRAVALDGPGAARDWLGDDWPAVDALANPEREAARAMLAERAARAPAGAEPPSLIIASRGDVAFVRVGDSPTYRECGFRALRAVSRECERADLLTMKTEEAIANATTCDEIETDFSREGSIVWDAASRRILRGVAPPAIAPRHDPAADAWLRALTGARYASVAEWIAGTSQRHIARPATALVVIGDHTIGKSLLAIACARLWGAPAPVPLRHAVARFNKSITSSPIVLDDECATLAARDVSTEVFRGLVADRTRTFEPKGLEQRRLHGAQRFVLTANDVTAIAFANAMGVAAVEAIAERLLFVETPRTESERVRELLDAVRLPDGEIDFDRLVGHLRWLQEVTPVPDARQRFIGADPDRASATRAALASTVADHAELFDLIRDTLAGEPTPYAPRDLFLAGGRLWIRPEGVGDGLGPLGRPYDPRRVRAAIGAFKTGARGVKVDGVSVRAWELDVGRLCVALSLDPDAVPR